MEKREVRYERGEVKMGKVLKPGVTIKGTKDGLLFLLDDSRPFSLVLDELKHKLEQQHSHMWAGPDMRVMIKLGERQLSKPEEFAIRGLFAIHKNLIIHEFESEGMPYMIEMEKESGIQLRSGTVRSGQLLSHTGDILFLGDVNPGGRIQATGNIYVVGALRGLAHAGADGDETAVIAASILCPTQLRIADVISRSPDQGSDADVMMGFAYLSHQQIVIEKMNQMSQIRPELDWKEPSFRF